MISLRYLSVHCFLRWLIPTSSIYIFIYLFKFLRWRNQWRLKKKNFYGFLSQYGEFFHWMFLHYYCSFLLGCYYCWLVVILWRNPSTCADDLDLPFNFPTSGALLWKLLFLTSGIRAWCWELLFLKGMKIEGDLGGVCFFGFLLKVICFQNLDCSFFYFFMTYYKLFTK